MNTPDYIDSLDNFKLIAGRDCDKISRRNMGIFCMWLTGLGIPEQEFVKALFIAGNWQDTEADEISLKRMARAISPGTDSDGSLRRAYERLKKASPRFFAWQEQQSFEIIPREIKNQNRKTVCIYKFPHYDLIIKLFNLPETYTQKQIRAEVAKALGDLMLPPPAPREKKQRKPEAIAARNARTVEELLTLTPSTLDAGFFLSEAWRLSLGDEVVDTLKEVL